MRKILLLALLMFTIAIPSFSHEDLSLSSEERYIIRSLDFIVDKTLQAYNDEDSIGFFKYFSPNSSALVSQKSFKAVYLDTYKKDFGGLQAKELLLEESLIDDTFPVLIYLGKFEQCAGVRIIFNFRKEKSGYKITQVRFDRVLF